MINFQELETEKKQASFCKTTEIFYHLYSLKIWSYYFIISGLPQSNYISVQDDNDDYLYLWWSNTIGWEQPNKHHSAKLLKSRVSSRWSCAPVRMVNIAPSSHGPNYSIFLTLIHTLITFLISHVPYSIMNFSTETALRIMWKFCLHIEKIPCWIGAFAYYLLENTVDSRLNGLLLPRQIACLIEWSLNQILLLILIVFNAVQKYSTF